MRIRRSHNYMAALGGSVALVALLLWLLTLPGAAQETPPVSIEPAAQSATVDTKNFQLLGVYSDTTWMGDISAGYRYAYVSFGHGLQVLDISNPAAVQHLGGRDTPQATPDIIEWNGTVLFMAVDRPIGFGGDYVERLSTQPITQPTLLGTYRPPASQGYYVTGITDIAFGLWAQLFVSQSEGEVVVLDPFSIGGDGKIPVVGNYATTDTVRNLLATYLLVVDTDSGVELATADLSPRFLGKLATVSRADAIALVGDTLFRATYMGLEIIDMSDSAALCCGTQWTACGISTIWKAGALCSTPPRAPRAECGSTLSAIP